MSNRRQSNIQVEVINGEMICAEIRKHMSELPPQAKLRFWSDMGLVRTPNGTFLIDSEGCGSSLPLETSPSEIEITRADIMLAGSPWTIKVSAKDATNIPISKTVNLAQFIRVFGARLENNYNHWNEFLSSKING